jgi:hypothetical protein
MPRTGDEGVARHPRRRGVASTSRQLPSLAARMTANAVGNNSPLTSSAAARQLKLVSIQLEHGLMLQYSSAEA